MKRYFVVVMLLAALPSFGGQDKDKKIDKKKLIEQADYYFFRENFPKALELYNRILHDYPKNHYVQYHAFVAYHLTTGRGEEMTALKEYEANEGLTDKFYNYWLGRIHYGRYEFELAERHFQAFLDMDIYRTNEIKKETEDLLKRTQSARYFHENPNDFEIEPLPKPINSAYADVSPAFYADHEELLFASSRTASQDLQFQVFHSYRSGERFSSPKEIAGLGILQPKTAKIEVVNNDGRLFLYKNDGRGDLYYAEMEGSSWAAPQAFNTKLTAEVIESHFFINDTEDLILFAAKGKNGKSDLLQSRFNSELNEWSEPEPLSNEVNSPFDEDYPFLSSDGQTLYFSSNRTGSIGGYDVFKSKINNETGQWSTPVNMGHPINTIDDEIGFQLNEDNISGFFSSNRLHGIGDFDIYYFHKQGKVLASGKVYNQETNELIPQARLAFHPLKYQDEAFSTSSDKFGGYELEIFENEEFVVEIHLGETILSTIRIQATHEDHRKSFEKDFYVTVPDNVESTTDFAALYQGKGSTESSYEKLDMIGSKFRSGEKAILNNIYFDLHATSYQEESLPTLKTIEKVLTENPSLVVEIGGHTCNIGSHETNLDVSLARAKSVKSYLTAQGISSTRLITKGYGETQPLASNDDEEDGREINRRIEIRVIK